ncbi:MAG: YihY/virulence factor BrkB family protein [Burkholderiales bacterium]
MARNRHTLREWSHLIKAACAAWMDDYAPSMGAALSYYSVFSLAPLLLIVIAIAGLAFDQEAARGEVVAQLGGLMGADAAKAVQDMLVSLGKPTNGITSMVISGIVLLIGATSVFGELQDALDRIWRAPARDRSAGWWGLIRARLLSFGMILGVAFLLVVSLVLSAVIAALGKWAGGTFDQWEWLLQLGNVGLGFLLTTLVFAMIYKLMPRVSVQWHDVWWGAATTSALFTAGRFLIGLYIGKSGIASGFGAAGSLAVIFVWVYYSAQIFLLGAEFTWVYAKQFGSLRALGEMREAEAMNPLHAEPAPVAARRRPHVAPVRVGAETFELAQAKSRAQLVPIGIAVAGGLAARFLLPWIGAMIVRKLGARGLAKTSTTPFT